MGQLDIIREDYISWQSYPPQILLLKFMLYLMSICRHVLCAFCFCSCWYCML